VTAAGKSRSRETEQTHTNCPSLTSFGRQGVPPKSAVDACGKRSETKSSDHEELPEETPKAQREKSAPKTSKHF